MKPHAGAALLILCIAHAPCAEPAMRLASADMKDGTALAKVHYYPRCGGRNLSPDLRWDGPPNATSYALTLVDRSVAPAHWSHWIVLDIPAGTHRLAQGAMLPAGAKTIASDFGDLSYDGPCPPAGSGVHHYDFTVYAFVAPQPPVPPGLNAMQLSGWLSRASVAYATLSVTAETSK
ncbi:MAG TPA: YbhB/YbcL family Raf kinase inhibitor-like protein [Xanthomonadaceae bacterium]|jgi:hypothetical protein